MQLGLPPQMEVYNLAFGDGIIGTGDFSDQITSDNGDMEMVLSTVADTTFYFWEKYPEANLFLTGISVVRTYLYQKKIERYWNEIDEVAYVAGRLNSQFELFKKGKSMMLF
jgi:predicted 3-demethylubiquinone-9 3-methyltransferase (glyoxalase superfamily)